MGQPFRHDRRVEFRDTDAAGIVHFSVFFNYMEEAEHAMLRDLGECVLMVDETGPFSFPRVAARCDYRAPLRFGDVVTIEVAVAEIGESSVTYEFGFLLDGKPVADGQVTAVCCRLTDEGKPKSMPIPQNVAAKLATLVK